jgi:peroxiredoxin Q/BCP
MIATGISRALPFACSSSNPRARGPLSARVARVVCAALIKTPRQASGMTTQAILRYNFVREGKTPMEVHDKAPEFSLPDQNGENVSLKDFRGKTVILFFYPKADTPGCTIEACGFRDGYKAIQKTGAVVLGISADSPQAQKKFEGKFDLPYPLLADTDKKICNAFGVIKEKNMYGKKVQGIVRTTFVIGPDGNLAHIFNRVKAEGHAEEVLAYLKSAA